VQVADMQMSFGLSWYSASCFDIFSRAFAGATVARIKRADMPAIMPQTSLRRPTLIDRLVNSHHITHLVHGCRAFCTRSKLRHPSPSRYSSAVT
jgi:hypothetical protein